MIIFYFLVLVMPLSQHRIWARFVGEMTGIKYLGLACLPYALIHLAARRSVPPFLQTWQARFFLLLYGFATFSHFTQGQQRWWLSHWLTYTSFVVLFFVTLVLVDSIERLRWVALSAVGAMALASLYVLRDWQLFHNVYKDYRPGWVVGDPNYFTVSVLLFMPNAFLLVRTSRPRWEKLFCSGCLVVTLLATMVSASRGGFLGVVASSLFLISKLHKRFLNLFLIGIALALLILFTPISPLERLVNPGQGDEDAVQVRKALWRGGLRMMQAHPILGVGLDRFKTLSPSYVDPEDVPQYERSQRVAHNSYVEIGAEMGIPALLTFLAILLCTLRSLGQTHRRAQQLGSLLLGQMALGLQTGLVGAAVAIFFVSGQYQKMFWLALFLSMIIPSLAEKTGEPANNAGDLLGRLRSNPAAKSSSSLTGAVSVFSARPQSDACALRIAKAGCHTAPAERRRGGQCAVV